MRVNPIEVSVRESLNEIGCQIVRYTSRYPSLNQCVVSGVQGEGFSISADGMNASLAIPYSNGTADASFWYDSIRRLMSSLEFHFESVQKSASTRDALIYVVLKMPKKFDISPHTQWRYCDLLLLGQTLSQFYRAPVLSAASAPVQGSCPSFTVHAPALFHMQRQSQIHPAMTPCQSVHKSEKDSFVEAVKKYLLQHLFHSEIISGYGSLSVQFEFFNDAGNITQAIKLAGLIFSQCQPLGHYSIHLNTINGYPVLKLDTEKMTFGQIGKLVSSVSVASLAAQYDFLKAYDDMSVSMQTPQVAEQSDIKVRVHTATIPEASASNGVDRSSANISHLFGKADASERTWGCALYDFPSAGAGT